MGASLGREGNGTWSRTDVDQAAVLGAGVGPPAT